MNALINCDVVKPKMTAELESDMNEIAEGKKTLDSTVKESREMLTKVMQELEPEKENIKTNITNAVREQNTIGTCPKCGKPLCGSGIKESETVCRLYRVPRVHEHIFSTSTRRSDDDDETV